MNAFVRKEFTQSVDGVATNYRLVETMPEHPSGAKLVLEYQAADLLGGAQWRTMVATGAGLMDTDPLAVMLRELDAGGWL